RAGRRMRTRMLIVLTAVAVPVWPVGGWRAMLALLAVTVPLGLIAATRQARAMRYAVSGPHVVIESGWLRRTRHPPWLDRIQVVALGASPFDRRHGMATVVVDTAAGSGPGARMEIPFLDAATARALADRLAAEAAGTRFEW